MELVNFLTTHKEDWRDVLSNSPYYIEIKDDGNYSILKYNLLMSDMNLELVKECRGTIIRKENDGYKIVCYPFRKFGNYSESYADTDLMDFSRATIQEKVDGSLFKFFFDNGTWKLATNGTIDSFKAECGDTTFGDVFYSIIQKYSSIKDFLSHMKTSRTYFFEMVHPQYNHIVVHYPEPAIYFLGCRDMETFEEIMFDDEFDNVSWIKHPKYYECHSLAECIEEAHRMGPDEEGYVATCYGQKINGSFLRVKIKGDMYLQLHKMRGNGPLTVLRVVEMYQQGTLDDFIAYYPEFKDFTDDVIQRIRYYIEVCETAFKVVNSVVGVMGERRDFAMYANTYKPIVRSYLYARLDEKVKDGSDYLMNMRSRTLASYIAAEMNQVTIGANEEND